MERELKSCTSVPLRADLTGHGQLTRFGRKGWDGHALLRYFTAGLIYVDFAYVSALKRTTGQDFNYFSIVIYYIISTKYQKVGDLFCPVHTS